MNALNAPERLAHAGHELVRRAPLTVRTLELLAVLALYVAGLLFVGGLSGAAHFPVVVAAMFGMPMVLSVALRWVRTLERRLHLGERHMPHLG